MRVNMDVREKALIDDIADYFNIIDPHLNLEVETGGDSRFLFF